MPFAPLVSSHEDLALAALDHAADVVINNVRGHQGSDGGSVMQRIRRYPRDFSMAGEDIQCAGYSKYLAVSGRLRSPPHCSNIMNEGITHVGLAYAPNPGTNRLIWVLKIGTPSGTQPERVVLPPYDVAPLRGRDITDIQQLTDIILVDNEVSEGAYTVRQLLDLMEAGERLGILGEGCRRYGAR